MPVFACDPNEVQAVKDALDRNGQNIGVGVLHEPTGRLHLVPIDSLPNRGGHAELATTRGLAHQDCKGVVVAKDAAGSFVVLNLSHLNGPQGMPGSLRMPQPLFDAIVAALRAAGL